MHVRYWRAAAGLGLAWLLAACTLQTNTIVQPTGAGEMRIEVGLTLVEQQMARTLGSTPDEICRELESLGDLPSGTTLVVEERGRELWCAFSRSFANLDDLRAIYAELEGVRVNQLEIVEEQFHYDVEVQVLGTALPEIPLASMDVRWQVTMPGRVLSHNAERVSGVSLSWSLATDQPLQMRASSLLTGGAAPIPFTVSGLSWLAAGLLLVCCCGGLAAAGGTGALLLVRRLR